MEVQAQEYLRQKNWIQAIDLYNRLLNNKKNTIEQVVSFLTDRAECYLELNNHQAVISDSKHIIKLSPDINNYNVCLARKRLIHSLYMLKRYTEADMAAREWLIFLQETDVNRENKPLLESLLGNFISCTNSKQKALNLLKILDANFSNNHIIPVKMSKSLSVVCCIYCNLSFADKIELRTHCQTEAHEMMIMSDDGRDWYCRPPPRGFKSEDYAICENWMATECRYGSQCVQAHGEDELNEWKERFRYREMRLKRAREKELFGKSYTEDILDKWIQTANPTALMREKLDDVEEHCSCPLSVTVSSKNSLHDWIFFIKTNRPLKAVALLQDTHRNHFFISSICVKNCKIDLKNDQEWISPLIHQDSLVPVDYRIKVVFTTGIFGTFRQSIVLDFSGEPVLVKHICVDVVPDSDLDRINEIQKEITVSLSERWNSSNSDIVPFQSTVINKNTNEEWEKALEVVYPSPIAHIFKVSQAMVNEKKFTKNNYRQRMHALLFFEEVARYQLVAQYNLTAKMKTTQSYILSPNGMATSTAKYAVNGELFASVNLGKELSEDTSEGRLILMHCNSVFLCPTDVKRHRRKVYEAHIEDKGKNTIYLRLPSKMVAELMLTPDLDVQAELQFQLNRIPYCEWHYTIDKMPNIKLIFPETFLEPKIPWSPSRQWYPGFDSRLNLKQKEAVIAITTSLAVPLPPILVIGPYGTGKTFTVAQAVKELIKEPSNRILLCTHSNSAADLYIKDYLDPWVEAGEENATPLRIYYTKRWVNTVSPIVQKYCMIDSNGSSRCFKIPTREDIEKYKIIVVTLSTSVYLSAMDLPQGFFTHILLDEAAQALECETVTPLVMANKTTRIVLAGDHMQLGPVVFSKFARERNLHVSLLERLYDHYPAQFPCKILLCENYRAHQSIIQFTSESFYDQKLISSSKQPKHSIYYPLTFFTTRGEDVQDKNSTAFYNNSEVYEVVERVTELKRNWPSDWGDYDDQSIGVVTPYSDQVFRIRSELRKRRIDNVCVERVLNVQGKQFRAIILSTVRTRKTCTNVSQGIEVNYGFLSNSKLLNTAITRAQSLVAVVGDPIALCSVGRCSKVWERFIQLCKEHDSLFGITWTQLKLQLDGIELKKIYTLNPLAPEFIPRQYKEMAAAAAAAAAASASNLIVSVPPPQSTVVPPPYPITDYSFYPPVIYPPQQPRPFVFNIIPPVHSLPNNFSQPMRMVNPNNIMSPRQILTQTVANAKATAQQTNNAMFASSQKPTMAGAAPSHNKLIQFMNNVHFPEANALLHDYINLLPQNMSLADMLVQPIEMQEKWYRFLQENIGIDAAQKFKYLLHAANQKDSNKLLDNALFERSTPQSCESPTFSWYDSPTNQINFNKPVYMTENPTATEPTSGPEGYSGGPFIYNGQCGPSSSSDYDLQRHINEEFARLNIESSDVTEVFKAFTDKNESPCVRVNGKTNSMCVGPRFYKYFH